MSHQEWEDKEEDPFAKSQPYLYRFGLMMSTDSSAPHPESTTTRGHTYLTGVGTAEGNRRDLYSSPTATTTTTTVSLWPSSPGLEEGK